MKKKILIICEGKWANKDLEDLVKGIKEGFRCMALAKGQKVTVEELE